MPSDNIVLGKIKCINTLPIVSRHLDLHYEYIVNTFELYISLIDCNITKITTYLTAFK